jgi:hypothetical protein
LTRGREANTLRYMATFGKRDEKGRFLVARGVFGSARGSGSESTKRGGHRGDWGQANEKPKSSVPLIYVTRGEQRGRQTLKGSG